MARTAKPTGRPVIPRAVQDDDQHVVVYRDGRPPRAAVMLAFEEHDIGAMRAGYVCVNCYEALDTAFPDNCPVCRFPMATRQSEVMATEFQGVVRVGPSTTLEEERAIMNEMRERRLRETRGIEVYKPTIIVPRGL